MKIFHKKSFIGSATFNIQLKKEQWRDIEIEYEGEINSVGEAHGLGTGTDVDDPRITYSGTWFKNKMTCLCK